MNVPLGYSWQKVENLPPNAICRLHKSIYGLRQTSHQWFHKFLTVLLEIGFVQSANDHSLFTRSQGYVFLILLVYVDDIIITSNNMAYVTDMKFDLSKLFTVRDLGPLKYFLELEIARTIVRISICQRKYALEFLFKVGYLGCKPFTIPMEPNLKLSKKDSDLVANPST